MAAEHDRRELQHTESGFAHEHQLRGSKIVLNVDIWTIHFISNAIIFSFKKQAEDFKYEIWLGFFSIPWQVFRCVWYHFLQKSPRRHKIYIFPGLLNRRQKNNLVIRILKKLVSENQIFPGYVTTTDCQTREIMDLKWNGSIILRSRLQWTRWYS